MCIFLCMKKASLQMKLSRFTKNGLGYFLFNSVLIPFYFKHFRQLCFI